MGAASLRVDSGVKRIEVNDNGDYIAVNISDNSFFKRFDDFVAWLNAKTRKPIGLLMILPVISRNASERMTLYAKRPALSWILCLGAGVAKRCSLTWNPLEWSLSRTF